MQTTDKTRNRWQTYDDMWVAEIVVEHQRLNIAEKYCVLYSLFRFKAVLQMGGNAQTVAVVTISMAIEIIYPFQPKNLS